MVQHQVQDTHHQTHGALTSRVRATVASKPVCPAQRYNLQQYHTKKWKTHINSITEFKNIAAVQKLREHSAAFNWTLMLSHSPPMRSAWVSSDSCFIYSHSGHKSNNLYSQHLQSSGVAFNVQFLPKPTCGYEYQLSFVLLKQRQLTSSSLQLQNSSWYLHWGLVAK